MTGQKYDGKRKADSQDTSWGAYKFNQIEIAGREGDIFHQEPATLSRPVWNPESGCWESQDYQSRAIPLCEQGMNLPDIRDF